VNSLWTNLFQEEKLENDSMSLISHLTDGLPMDELVLLDVPEEKDSIQNKELLLCSRSITKSKKKERKSVIVESVLSTSEKILTDKSSISLKNTQDTKLSLISDPVLIGKEKGFKPFWNEYTATRSNELWLPTKTGCVDLDQNSLSSSLKKHVQNSWFTVKTTRVNQLTQPKNYQTTLLQSSLPLLQELMESDQVLIVNEEQSNNEPKKSSSNLKTRKIKLNPTTDQKNILNKWFNTARWTYNKCVELIKTKKAFPNKKSLRSTCINESVVKKENSWVLETPYDVRDEAMNDFLKSLTYLKTTGKKFELKYRTKKDSSQSIVVCSKHYKSAGMFFPKFLGKKPIRGYTTPLPDKLNHDTRLQRTRMGEFYLCVLSPADSYLTISNNDNIISLDPGVRTFMTGYDPSGTCYEWGKNDMKNIFRIAYAADKIQSEITSEEIKHKKRYRLKKAMLRLNKRIKCLVNDLHEKLSKWLVENYKVIIIPEFNTSRMVKRKNRMINSKTARAMVTWSHFAFRQKLLNKSKEYPECRLIFVSEEYTSKTCGCCGELHHKLKSKKVFYCKHCKIVIDRDYNGARNILLKFLTDLRPTSTGGYLKSRVGGKNPFYVVA
jgi:putative transposase